VPIDWRHGARELTGRDQVLDLAPGDILRLARADRSLPRGEPLPGADDIYEIGITAEAGPPPARGR
jgi:hypothetical protein